MDIKILHEDFNLLVIDKPHGVVVNRADTVKESTIQDWCELRLKINDLGLKNEENKDFFDRSGIVHRLDKETSGCLIIAKDYESFLKLQAAFKNHFVKKEYIALVHGHLKPANGDVNVPIGRLPWNRERFGVVPGGKESHTKYEVTGFFQKDKEKLSLLKLMPTTGRTHQIRVHMKYLGFPLVGDYLYAGRKTQVHDRKWCPRVFLHAARISFPHPIENNEIKVEAKLPSDLSQILQSLNKL